MVMVRKCRPYTEMRTCPRDIPTSLMMRNASHLCSSSRTLSSISETTNPAKKYFKQLLLLQLLQSAAKEINS